MDTSPGWKRPSLVKLKQKRRASLPNAKRIVKNLNIETGSGASHEPQEALTVKRRNPFEKDKDDNRNDSVKKLCADGGALLSDITSRRSSSMSSLPSSSNTDGVLLQFLGNKEDCDTNRSEAVPLKMPDFDISKRKHNLEGGADFPVMMPDQPSGFAMPACDWSIKNRIRFLSAVPFTWCQNVKSIDQSVGISNFTRCSNNTDLPTHIDQLKIPNSDLSQLQSSIQQHCLVWQHPHLPWFNTFPRILSHSRVGKVSVINSNDEIVSALHKDWVSSFTSVFQLLRSGTCPYFYMCTHQYSVVFRGPGMAGCDDSHALITPTTRGIREALKKEGIEFTMPAVCKKRTSTENKSFENTQCNKSSENTPQSSGSSENTPHSSPSSENAPQRNQSSENTPKLGQSSYNTPQRQSPVLNIETSPEPGTASPQPTDDEEEKQQESADEEKENIDEADKDELSDDDVGLDDRDSAASDWLESIGLNKAKYRSLDPHKVKIKKEGFRVIDNRPESVILVSGLGDLQALFNYLINCRTCISSSGVQAGVPPTILAPTAFVGATLKQLKTRCNKVQSTDKRREQLYTMEVTGPILPHTFYGLCEIFTHTHSQYTVGCSVHEPTSAFNVVEQKVSSNDSEKSINQDGVDGDVGKLGLSPNGLQCLNRASGLDKKGIKELNYQQKLYTWSV